MTNGKTSRRYATARELHHVFELLRQNVRRLSGDEGTPGECEFLEGWTDQRVALEVDKIVGNTSENPMSAATVKNRREELYGPLHKEPKRPPTDPATAAAVAELERRVGILSAALLRVTSAFNSFVVDHDQDRRAVSIAWEAELQKVTAIDANAAPAGAVVSA